MKRIALALIAFLAFSASALAQWQVPLNSVPIGRGPGVVGFTSVAPGAANHCLLSDGTAWISAVCPATAVPFTIGNITIADGADANQLHTINGKALNIFSAANPMLFGTSTVPYGSTLVPSEWHQHVPVASEAGWIFAQYDNTSPNAQFRLIGACGTLTVATQCADGTRTGEVRWDTFLTSIGLQTIATIDVTKGTGNGGAFHVRTGTSTGIVAEAFVIKQSPDAADAYLIVQNAVAASSAVTLYPESSATNASIALNPQAAGTVQINNPNGARIANFKPTINSVTSWEFQSNTTGNAPTLTATGETNTAATFRSTGNASHFFQNSAGDTLAQIAGGASLVNYPIITPAVAGTNASITTNTGSIHLGSITALATNAIVGFPTMPGMPGAPVGAPTNASNSDIPFVADTTNAYPYWRIGGVWRAAGMLPLNNTWTGTNGFQAITATTFNGNAWTAGTGTLAIGASKTATISNTLTLTATDGSTLAIGTGGTLGSNAYTSTAYAPLASPTFTGIPAAPTAAVATNTTQLATTAYVKSQQIWANWAAGGTTINANNGFASMARPGVGQYNLTFSTAFADTNYSCDSTVIDNTGTTWSVAHFNNSTTVVLLTIRNAITGVLTDPAQGGGIICVGNR